MNFLLYSPRYRDNVENWTSKCIIEKKEKLIIESIERILCRCKFN